MARTYKSESRVDMEQYNSFLETAPTHGSLDQEVTWGTLTENEGRDNRPTVNAKYVSDNNPSLSVILNVTQKGKPIFIDVISPRNCVGSVIEAGSTTEKTIAVSSDGETLTLDIRSNAQKLYYFTDTTGVPVENAMQFDTLLNTYTIDGAVSAINNANISGDPGKTRAFSARLQLTILENESIVSKSGAFYIRAYDENGSYCTYVINLKQEQDEEYLWIGKNNSTEDSLTLEYYEGSTGVQSILSNGNWHLVIPN